MQTGNSRLPGSAWKANCSRNAPYDGHPEFLHEIQTAIAKQRQAAGQTRRAAKHYGTEADLDASREDRQRLISEHAELLLRAVTAEEALARMNRRAPVPLKMNVLQTGSSMALVSRAISPVGSELRATEPRSVAYEPRLLSRLPSQGAGVSRVDRLVKFPVSVCSWWGWRVGSGREAC